MRLLSIITLLFLTAIKISAQSYALNVQKSNIHWKGKAAFGSYSVQGSLIPKEGFMNMKDGAITGAEIRVNMKTLKAEITRLEKHLKSKDFFHVKQYQWASFQLITPFDYRVNSSKIGGWLKIKNQRKYQEFKINVTASEESIILNATIILDRTHYGIIYKSENFFDNLKDEAIHDEFTIQLELLFEKLN